MDKSEIYLKYQSACPCRRENVGLVSVSPTTSLAAFPTCSSFSKENLYGPR